jgi:hypothetical protein
MKNHRWLTMSVVLALAVVMLWAVPTLAQGRGQGQGGQGQGQSWGCGQGQGAGSGVCAVNPADQGRQGSCVNNPQANTGRRGPRGSGRMNQPNTQPTAPPTQ